MCGICGELRFDAASPDLGAIERMSESLARRGPDHAGTFAQGPLSFGHRRSAIIDLSASADQPMVDSALQLALVFNGTIYNYRELRDELVGMGYAFFSQGDSGVILKAYDAWGEQCVERFFGMFAFAVWDMRRGCVRCRGQRRCQERWSFGPQALTRAATNAPRTTWTTARSAPRHAGLVRRRLGLWIEKVRVGGKTQHSDKSENHRRDHHHLKHRNPSKSEVVCVFQRSRTPVSV